MARRDGKRAGKAKAVKVGRRSGPSTGLRAGGRQVNKTLARLSPGFRVPVSPAEVPVRVVAVAVAGGGERELVWEFSVPVSSVTTAGGGELRASADGVTFESPTSVAVQGGGGGVVATYPAGGPVLAAGSVFEVSAPPTGVTFSGATAGVALPQAGQVVEGEGAGTRTERRSDRGAKGKTVRIRAAARRKPGAKLRLAA